MNSFPLIRLRWSNEHLMTVVFVVTILYLAPIWSRNPQQITSFLLLLILALAIDATLNLIRYQRPVCAVSAAVTTGILQVLTPGIPFGVSMAGVASALISKHLGGGTGKNIFNPAMVGLVVISMFHPLTEPLFSDTYRLIPALLLSLPLLFLRPYPVIGLVGGMLTALAVNGHLSGATISANGIIFWGCLVITDPVTTTFNPWLGLIGGFLVGFTPGYLFGNSLSWIVWAVLLFNLASYLLERFGKPTHDGAHRKLKIGRFLPFSFGGIPLHYRDLPVRTLAESDLPLEPREIMQRIETNGVFGCGGAAFSTYRKLKTLQESQAAKQYLIVNAVECDPGLIHDQWLLRTFPREIGKGIELVARIGRFSGIWIAVKDAKGLRGFQDCRIFQTSNYYPAGAEKNLIKTILKMELPDQVPPAARGILVLNVQTVYAIFEAVYWQQKISSRYLTLVHLKKREYSVVKVRLGENISRIVAEIFPGGLRPGEFIFSGGGMMQSHVVADDETVEPQTNLIAIADMPRYKESPLCSKCGACALHCQAGLPVHKIAALVERGQYDAAAALHPEKCMRCGTCSYLCLAGKNLMAKVVAVNESTFV